MKKIIIILFCIISFSSLASSGDQRRKELIKLIDEQIAEIVRLGKSVSSSPRYLLELAELNLEKARHIRDMEDARWMALPVEKVRRLNKKRFFRKSRHYIYKAESYCRTIMRKFPHFRYKGDVYYIMAFNAKEFGQFSKAQRYFMLASKERCSDPKLKLKAHIALADIFYNQNNFRKAITHYEIGLRKKLDQWWTKDAFNLAWCYYQEGQYDKGISLLREVIKKSKSKRYVNMRDQASRDLARFYVQAGRIDEAVRYYKSNFSNANKKLVELGEYLIGQSKYTKAIPILEEAKSLSKHDTDLQLRANFALLKAYGKFGKFHKQLSVAQAIMPFFTKAKLNKSEKTIFSFNVKKSFAVLQRRVAGKMYSSRPMERKRLAKVVAEFGKLMKQIEPNKEIAYSYLAAESFYQAKDYSNALVHYRQTLELAKRKKHRKYIQLSLDGVAACLAKTGQDKDKSKLKEVYAGYLALNPANKKAHTIYQRLFSQQMKEGQVVEAETTFKTFRKYFSRDLRTSEAMLAQVMDYYLKKGDKKNFNRLYGLVAAGQIKVSRKYAQQLKKASLGLQFQDVQKASTEGQKKKALLLYVSIYRDPSSSLEARKTAAYNIMRMFYMLGDAKRMYLWADRTLSHMNNHDIIKFQSAFNKLTLELFERRRFEYATNIYSQIYKRICSSGSSIIQDGFNNMLVMMMAKEHLDVATIKKIRNLLKTSRRCHINKSIVRDIRIDLLKRFLEDQRWYYAKEQFLVLKQEARNWNLLISPAFQLYLHYRQGTYRKNVEKFYRYAVRHGKTIDIHSANAVYHLRSTSFLSMVRRFNKLSLHFPEKRFNRTMKRKFGMLAKMMTTGVRLVNIGSSDGVVEVYASLLHSYDNFIEQINSVKLKGKGPAFVKSFKQSMQGIVKALASKRQEIINQAKQLISQHDILSNNNLQFFSELDQSVRYSSLYQGLLMDRGGEQ